MFHRLVAPRWPWEALNIKISSAGLCTSSLAMSHGIRAGQSLKRPMELTTVGTVLTSASIGTVLHFSTVRGNWVTYFTRRPRRSRTRWRHARAGVPSHIPLLATATIGTLGEMINHGVTTQAG